MRIFIGLFISCLCFFASGQHSPVVFVHGMLASSDTWTKASEAFLAAGYHQKDLYFFDWNTLNPNRERAVEELELFIKQALKESKSKTISLVGHSAGGALSMSFIQDTKLGKKVIKYIHVGSMPITSNPPMPVMNLYSNADLITGGKNYDFDNVINKPLEDLDHYEIATAPEAVHEMVDFLKEKRVKPRREEQLYLQIGGRVVTMGENQPEDQAQLAFYEVNPSNGERQSKSPFATIQTDKNGYWSLNRFKKTGLYEVIVSAKGDDKRKVHYYFHAPAFDTQLLYFRTLPSTGFAAMMFATLPQDDRPCLVIYSASKSLIHGRDTLLINNQNIITEKLASPKKTPISFFVYAADENKDELTGIPVFGSFPFLSGVNMYLAGNKPIQIENNSNIVFLYPVKSKDGIMVYIKP